MAVIETRHEHCIDDTVKVLQTHVLGLRENLEVTLLERCNWKSTDGQAEDAGGGAGGGDSQDTSSNGGLAVPHVKASTTRVKGAIKKVGRGRGWGVEGGRGEHGARWVSMNTKWSSPRNSPERCCDAVSSYLQESAVSCRLIFADKDLTIPEFNCGVQKELVVARNEGIVNVNEEIIYHYDSVIASLQASDLCVL